MDIKKLLKKTEKDAKAAKKDDKKDNTPKPAKKKDEDDEDTGVVLVNIEQTKDDKPKQQKIVINRVQEEEITYEVPKPKDQPAKPVRSSWVPAEGGVVRFFDLEKDKEHFVAIGEDYKPPPEKGMGNFAPLNNADQSKMVGNQTTLVTDLAFKPRFTNVAIANNGPANITKTPQQLKEEELAAKLDASKSKTLTKEEREARDAERKKREEEAAQSLGIQTGSQAVATEERKIPTFKKSDAVNPPTRAIEKTAQQLKEQQMDAKAKASGLVSTALSKEEIEQRKLRAIEREQKQKQDEIATLERKRVEAEVPEDRKPRFTNSKKPVVEPTDPPTN